MKKSTSRLLTGLLACGCIAGLILLYIRLSSPSEDAVFEAFTDRLFTAELMEDTLSMHYTLADPTSFGITEYEPTLPLYNQTDSTHEAVTEESADEDFLLPEQIAVQNLTAENAYAYTLLQKKLKLNNALRDYPYFEEPLSPQSGIPTQLPILLAEYSFRTEQDITDYLALLDQVDDCFASLLIHEQQKASAGMFMSEKSLEKVLNQCDTMFSARDLKNHSSFLQTTFAERLSTLPFSLSAEQKKDYIAQNDRLLKTVVAPAYEKLADGLFLLKPQCGTASPVGLAAYSKGADYYQLLLAQTTGSYRTPTEWKEVLSAQLTKEFDTLCKLISEHPSLKEALTKPSDTLPVFASANTILQQLKNVCSEDFPPLPEKEEEVIVNVKTVSESLQDFCAPAFYLTSPIDDTTHNVIYINPKSTQAGAELYTTLAHEGIPGHLYQNVYCNRYLAQSGDNKIRLLLNYGGYSEGWALYTEFLSYDYLTKLLQHHKLEKEGLYLQLEKHNRNLQLCLFSLLDIMIHFENSSRENAYALLSSFGFKDPESLEAIYDYIAENPCNYPKYYLGYLELLSLKKLSVEQWKEEYSDRRFHQFFLECGPSDFSSMRERLKTTPTHP